LIIPGIVSAVIGHEAFGVLMLSIPRALRVTAFRVRLSGGAGSDRGVLALEFNLVQEDRFTLKEAL
jgi:hypothetical protein